MSYKLILLTTSLTLVGCQAGTSSYNNNLQVENRNNTQKSVYSIDTTDILPECTPSFVRNDLSSRVAYAPHCGASDKRLTDDQKENLQRMSIAILRKSGSRFASLCTAVPISYNESTQTGYALTAAHCVTGNFRMGSNHITANNIVTFLYDWDNLYQGISSANAKKDLNGKITAVYVPSQFCRGSNIDDEGCDPRQQDGDIAVLKVTFPESNPLRVLANVQIAPENLSLISREKIIGAGYGANNFGSKTSNRELFYVDYQYLGTNKYGTVSSKSSILNGYFYNSGYYSMICQGDSGGPDYVGRMVDNQLVLYVIGLHSFGSPGCGARSPRYTLSATDVSSDIRPFNKWIQKIVATDQQQTGCVDLGDEYLCKSRED